MKTKSKANVTANFDLKIGEEVVSLCAPVPDSKVSAVELIPVYQLLTNQIVSHSIEQSVKAGKNISCKDGCASCCSQPVPVTELEALHLANVVKRMPESRQSRIRQRFADSQAALAAAGLEGSLKEITNLDKESRRDIGIKYFSLGLNCPFLENKSCSIYSDRPLECREYLVTSEPKHCEQLNAKEIKHITSKLRLTPALTKQSQECFGEKSPGWMLMLYCLDWAKSDKTRLRKKSAKLWLQEFVSLGTNRKL
jgi:Fe-S-cluster containining protein